MKIIFMGTPDFSVGTLEALVEAGHEVVLAVTQPDKPKGRGKEMQFTPVKECALAHNIPVYQPKKIREPECIEELKKYKWFVATCKYEGIVGKKHCFTYDVDNLNTNLLSGMILVDDELVKETEEKGVWQDCVFDAICDEKVQIVQQCSKPIILYEEIPEYDEWVNLLLYRYLEQHYYEKKWMTYIQVDRKMNDEMRLS